MPIYTIGIVAFFVFTIVKIVMKKANKSKPVPRQLTPDPQFEERVFKPAKAAAPKKEKLGEKTMNRLNSRKHWLIAVIVLTNA